MLQAVYDFYNISFKYLLLSTKSSEKKKILETICWSILRLQQKKYSCIQSKIL